jgi:UDP-N-acetylmuramoyl-tripeptide--D-alanyl-D-alanine ligase
MKKKLIEGILRKMAEMVLKKREPVVVGITGSVGKTTTKEAVARVLALKFKVRSSQKNYNTEIGAPLTILGCQVDYNKNKILQILGVFSYWLQAMFFDKNYPEVLVLELGADKPGDIKYFCDFIPITVGVLTDIGISHLEKFKTKQNLATEKGHLLRSIQSNGLAVYNYDNKAVREIGERISVSAIGYGFENGAEMKATDISYNIAISEETKEIKGINFKLNYQGKVLPVRLKNHISRGAIYSSLAAFSVGEYFGLNLIQMIEILRDLDPCLGRMNLLKGKKDSMIIDDSYNSAPDSVGIALMNLSEIRAERKIVVLGDMLELGSKEERAHRNIGKLLRDSGIDLFVAVGDRMKLAKEELNKIKSNQETAYFDNPIEAGDFVENLLKPGDLVLVKGSQGMRMEKVVEKILSESENKNNLLVRQEEKWRETVYRKP